MWFYATPIFKVMVAGVPPPLRVLTPSVYGAYPFHYTHAPNMSSKTYWASKQTTASQDQKAQQREYLNCSTR